MQEHKFNEILDYLCSDIISKTESQNVRDEIYDHLMCKYETNLAVGLDDEQAEKKAVEELGDISTLRFKLGQVHSYAPKLSLKKAMNLLIFGYFLTCFNLSFFNGMKEITSFIGTVCMIVALFCFRTSNNKFKIAFYSESVSSVISWIAFAINPIYAIPFVCNASIIIVSNVLSLISFFIVLLGIRELVIPHMTAYPKKIPFVFCIFMNGLWAVINTVLLIVMVDSGEFYTNYKNTFLFVLFFFIIILNFFVLVRSSKVLWSSDHEYKIENSSARKIVVALLAVVFATFPTVTVDFFLATQKAETSDYSIEDYEMTQGDYERICSKMLAYGIPQNVIYSLPKSEIANYSDCFEITEYSQREQNFIHYTDYGPFSFESYNDGIAVRYSTMLFEIKNSDGRSHYRILSWLDYSNIETTYDEAFFFNYNHKAFIPLNYDGKYNDNFLLILSEEDGKLIENEPLDVYTNEKSLTDEITGIRFEGKEELLIVHAADYCLVNTKYLGNSSDNYINFIHRKWILTYPYRSMRDFENISSLNDWGLDRTQIFSNGTHVPMPYEQDKYKDLIVPEDLQ